MATLKEVVSCTSDYDPDALPVAKANEVIRSFVAPISGGTARASRAGSR